MFTAVFSMGGFEQIKEMSGEPKEEYGFVFPAISKIGQGNRSLSAYFKLVSFNGKMAHYMFYDFREMGKLS